MKFTIVALFFVTLAIAQTPTSTDPPTTTTDIQPSDTFPSTTAAATTSDPASETATELPTEPTNPNPPDPNPESITIPTGSGAPMLQPSTFAPAVTNSPTFSVPSLLPSSQLNSTIKTSGIGTALPSASNGTGSANSLQPHVLGWIGAVLVLGL